MADEFNAEMESIFGTGDGMAAAAAAERSPVSVGESRAMMDELVRQQLELRTEDPVEDFMTLQAHAQGQRLEGGQQRAEGGRREIGVPSSIHAAHQSGAPAAPVQVSFTVNIWPPSSAEAGQESSPRVTVNGVPASPSPGVVSSKGAIAGEMHFHFHLHMR